MTTIYDIPTPSLIVDTTALQQNLATMAAAHPGAKLRPHVKAHKCTALAKEQAKHGHDTFCCATVREMVGMAEAGLGYDLLLANEALEPALRPLKDLDARITVAVDSKETVHAAATVGIKEVLIDVNVGLPRCGCMPEDAHRIAEHAFDAGLTVRGVMGYEGHCMIIEDAAERREACAASMEKLVAASKEVGPGKIISAGGTGTYDLNTWANEIQAGSYALMDTEYAKLEVPFVQALWVWSTVISKAPAYAVSNAGLKCLGMDHGNPAIDGANVWFCSDEHTTFRMDDGEANVGDRVRIAPAHIDPTMAYHERLYLIDGEQVIDEWAIDLRGW